MKSINKETVDQYYNRIVEIITGNEYQRKEDRLFAVGANMKSFEDRIHTMNSKEMNKMIAIKAEIRNGIVAAWNGKMDIDTGEIEYTVFTDTAKANHMDQQLQCAVGVDESDLLQNGAAMPYIDDLLNKFGSIEIILKD